MCSIPNGYRGGIRFSGVAGNTPGLDPKLIADRAMAHMQKEKEHEKGGQWGLEGVKAEKRTPIPRHWHRASVPKFPCSPFSYSCSFFLHVCHDFVSDHFWVEHVHGFPFSDLSP